VAVILLDLKYAKATEVQKKIPESMVVPEDCATDLDTGAVDLTALTSADKRMAQAREQAGAQPQNSFWMFELERWMMSPEQQQQPDREEHRTEQAAQMHPQNNQQASSCHIPAWNPPQDYHVTSQAIAAQPGIPPAWNTQVRPSYKLECGCRKPEQENTLSRLSKELKTAWR
jgi:hypothetical protein